MIQFAWPWIFILLPLPWLTWYFLPPVKNTNKAALKVPFFSEWIDLNKPLSTPRQGKSEPLFWLVLVWLFLVVAGTRPEWVGDPIHLPVSGRDLMMAVDLSGSMSQPDFSIDGEQVNRLMVVKAMGGDFIERREGDRLGLILFGRNAYVQTPLTYDRMTVKTMLYEAEIGMAGKETAIGDAIGLAVKRFKDRPEESRVLVLLTDGANTAGEVEPLQAAKLASDMGLRIYTIGVGADRMRVDSFFGSQIVNPSRDLDEKTLTGIAEVTGGAYFRAKDTQGLAEIYQKLDELEPTLSEEETFRPVKSLFYYFLAMAILLGFILAWRRGAVSFVTRVT